MFNLRLHIRIYLAAYVRYLCRTKSHLCRSQNKLLIIEIRRILALRKWFTHDRHPRAHVASHSRPVLFPAAVRKVTNFIMRQATPRGRNVSVLPEIVAHVCRQQQRESESTVTSFHLFCSLSRTLFALRNLTNILLSFWKIDLWWLNMTFFPKIVFVSFSNIWFRNDGIRLNFCYRMICNMFHCNFWMNWKICCNKFVTVLDFIGIVLQNNIPDFVLHFSRSVCYWSKLIASWESLSRKILLSAEVVYRREVCSFYSFLWKPITDKLLIYLEKRESHKNLHE